VDNDSNAMLFDIEKAPMVEEHVAVSIDKESKRMEQGKFVQFHAQLNFCQIITKNPQLIHQMIFLPKLPSSLILLR